MLAVQLPLAYRLNPSESPGIWQDQKMYVASSQLRSIGVSSLTMVPRIPRDSLVVPFAVALTFSAIHIMYKLAIFFRSYKGIDFSMAILDQEQPNEPLTFFQAIRDRARDHGGRTIFYYAIAHLIGCVTLLALSSIILKRCFNGIEVGTSQLGLFFQFPESYMFLTFVRLLHMLLVSRRLTNDLHLALFIYILFGVADQQ
jgi:hypothetical protein